MHKFRIAQRKNESVDFTVMRAFAKTLPQLKRHEALAAARWMLAYASDPKTKVKE